jgi:hypothetical protein
MAYYDAPDTSNLQYRMRSHHDSARYCGVNLHSWFYRKTIEFRVFNSSLNPERVQGYIGMCMAMVQTPATASSVPSTVATLSAAWRMARPTR